MKDQARMSQVLQIHLQPTRFVGDEGMGDEGDGGDEGDEGDGGMGEMRGMGGWGKMINAQFPMPHTQFPMPP